MADEYCSSDACPGRRPRRVSAACSPSQPAGAQHPERHGYWLRVGTGYGSARSSSLSAAFSSLDGVSAYAGVGGTLSRSVQVGAIVEGWSQFATGNRATIEDVLASIYLYPVANRALFVLGGFGFAAYQGDVATCLYSSEYTIGPGCGTTPDAEYGTPSRASGSAWGPAFTAGIGYDLPVAHRMLITPSARFTGIRLGTSLKGDLGGLTQAQCGLPCPGKLLQLGVGVSYR
jgi:hypothetical protein